MSQKWFCTILLSSSFDTELIERCWQNVYDSAVTSCGDLHTRLSLGSNPLELILSYQLFKARTRDGKSVLSLCVKVICNVELQKENVIWILSRVFGVVRNVIVVDEDCAEYSIGQKTSMTAKRITGQSNEVLPVFDHSAKEVRVIHNNESVYSSSSSSASNSRVHSRPHSPQTTTTSSLSVDNNLNKMVESQPNSHSYTYFQDDFRDISDVVPKKILSLDLFENGPICSEMKRLWMSISVNVSSIRSHTAVNVNTIYDNNKDSKQLSDSIIQDIAFSYDFYRLYEHVRRLSSINCADSIYHCKSPFLTLVSSLDNNDAVGVLNANILSQKPLGFCDFIDIDEMDTGISFFQKGEYMSLDSMMMRLSFDMKSVAKYNKSIESIVYDFSFLLLEPSFHVRFSKDFNNGKEQSMSNIFKIMNRKLVTIGVEKRVARLWFSSGIDVTANEKVKKMYMLVRSNHLVSSMHFVLGNIVTLCSLSSHSVPFSPAQFILYCVTNMNQMVKHDNHCHFGPVHNFSTMFELVNIARFSEVMQTFILNEEDDEEFESDENISNPKSNDYLEISNNLRLLSREISFLFSNMENMFELKSDVINIVYQFENMFVKMIAFYLNILDYIFLKDVTHQSSPRTRPAFFQNRQFGDDTFDDDNNRSPYSQSLQYTSFRNIYGEIIDMFYGGDIEASAQNIDATCSKFDILSRLNTVIIYTQCQMEIAMTLYGCFMFD